MELNVQVLTFLMTILTGMLLGGLFDCYRVLRRVCKPRIVMTWFTDLLYWFIATGVVFVALVFSNWGELRFYVFIGVLSGVGMYYQWLSSYLISFFVSGISVMIKLLQLVRKIISFVFKKPCLYVKNIVTWPFIFSYKKARYWCHERWFKPPDEKI